MLIALPKYCDIDIQHSGNFALQRVLSHYDEAFENVGLVLGRSLQERDAAILLAPTKALARGDLALHLPVQFVSDQEERERGRVFGSHSAEEEIPPARNRLERLSHRDVVDDYATFGPLVEGAAQTLKPLLSCRVPDLRLDKSQVPEGSPTGPPPGRPSSRTPTRSLPCTAE